MLILSRTTTMSGMPATPSRRDSIVVCKDDHGRRLHVHLALAVQALADLPHAWPRLRPRPRVAAHETQPQHQLSFLNIVVVVVHPLGPFKPFIHGVREVALDAEFARIQRTRLTPVTGSMGRHRTRTPRLEGQHAEAEHASTHLAEATGAEKLAVLEPFCVLTPYRASRESTSTARRIRSAMDDDMCQVNSSPVHCR